MGRLFICLILFSVLLARLDRIFYKANGSFCVGFISNRAEPYQSAQTRPLAQSEIAQIRSILSQPFTYWTKGNQAFVFLSADERYVLKFYRRLSPKKLTRALNSYKNAFNDLQSESMLIGAHAPLDCPVQLRDKLGVNYEINLKDTSWVLQQRAERFFVLFDRLIKDEEKAKIVISNTIQLYKSCWEKDYIDRDAVAETNFGLCGLQPMLLDSGQFEKGAQQLPLREYLLAMTNSLRTKLEKESPPLYSYYLALIDE